MGNVERIARGEAMLTSIAADRGGEVLGNYTSAKEKIRLRCAHGHEWEAMTSSILHHGSWCPTCGRASRAEKMKTPMLSEARFRAVVASKGGTVIGGFVHTKAKISLRCRHGHEWEATPNNIGNGRWCPHCRAY